MASSNDPQSKHGLNIPPDSGLLGGYPPPSSHSIDGLSPPPQSAGYAQSRGMDRFLGKLLTFLGIIAVFIVLVFLLKNISPNSSDSMDITPGYQSGGTELNEEADTDIVGD